MRSRRPHRSQACQLLTSQTQNIVGSSNLTRHFSLSYDATSGQLTQAVAEPGNSALSVTAALAYDSYGNRNSTSLSGTGITTRSTSATYDSLGEFALTSSNALSQTDHWTHNAAFGEPLSHTDLNSLVTGTTYDTFGRPTLITRPDGNKTAIAYNYCSGVNGGTATCLTNGAYQVQATPETSSGTQNGPKMLTYYDALGRLLENGTQGFDGSWIAAVMHYDANGRMSQNTRPYFVSGGTAKWTYYTFDALGRVTKATFPDGSVTTYGYNGLTTTVTNDKSQVTTTLRNAQGLVASVTDANSKTTSYVYDAFGNVTKVTDPAGNIITNTFDLRGRKTASTDPDVGSWSYAYDVLSELTSQTDAKSQTTSLTYDLTGRPTQRVESGMTSNWVYDTATTGVGMPTSGCTGSSCTSPSNATTFEAHAYDSYGRPSTLGLTVGGTTYTYTTAYDSNGRVSTVTYPSGFVAEYDYTSLGYLSAIKDHSTGAAIWTANSADAELHLTQETAGNGVITDNSFDANTGRLLNICATNTGGTCNGNVANLSYSWDTIGNLTDRADTIEGYTEEFCYDSLNRLVNYAIGSSCTSGSPAKTVAYDSLGNISSKSDVGTYTYPTAGSAHPHAVSSITGTVNGVVNPTFTYDANGNMTAGDGRTITYTSFNMAASVVEGTTTVGFVYGPEHQRYEQCLGGCTSPTTTTIYLNGPGHEEKVVSGSTVTWNDYIAANGGIVAERFNSMGVISTTYFVADHLGSTSVLTNASAAVSERDSYDAFGRRRNANGTDNSSCSITSQTTRGFTGQEMMDSVCLVNMNARVYDQTLGNFQSADSIVPDALNGQAYNRFSYVSDNPLNAIDPSGHADCQTDGIGCTNKIKPINPNDCSVNECVVVTAERIATDVFALANEIIGIEPAEAAERSGDGDKGKNLSCSPAQSTSAEVANVADDISTVASVVALASSAAALVSSETVIGGVTFGGVAAVAGGISFAASGVGLIANVAAGRYGNAGIDAFSMAVGVGTGMGAKSIRAGVQVAREAAGELMSESASSICPG